jgi:hypothetical protein
MSRTNFTGPISFGEDTGSPTTDTRGWVSGRRVVLLSQAASLKTIAIPAGTVVTKCGFVPTSAFTGTDPVSAMNITFRNGTIVLGVIPASADTRYHETTIVSGAVFDASANLTVSLSAQSTTVFTGGGGRAFIEYITVE